jgi:poly(A) polymerase/tRNA nucleotidyltransferase (CCA-adding enzyme)
VQFVSSLAEDLARRDFTINAMALACDGSFVDPFGGGEDIRDRRVRAVGIPADRFREDALRLMRAVRFAAQLNFVIEPKTFAAIVDFTPHIADIAVERVRDELVRIVLCENATRGFELLEQGGLLEFIIPELRKGIGTAQNRHHIYDVWEHNLRSLEYASRKEYSLEVRLASLLHDVGKPRSKRGEGPNATFYGHEVIGAHMTRDILTRLKFAHGIIQHVTHLVRYHQFYYNVDEVTEAGVRRFIARVGADCLDDLIRVREADRIGSGVPKAQPYRLRHLMFMIDKVRRDPMSPKMLCIHGDDVMRILSIAPGPRIGWILAILLDEVLEDPARNTAENLELRVRELGTQPDRELATMAQDAAGRTMEFETGAEQELKRRHAV